jgi:hypothetical protein
MKVEKENAIGGRWKVLSLQDYLREKSEESRYNQTQAHLLVVLGVVLFSVGTIITVLITESPGWFLIVPYCVESSPYHLLALFFTLTGLASVVSGGILSVKYRLNRGQYLNELRKIHEM